MGQRTYNLHLILEELFAAELLPRELWAYRCVVDGLASLRADTRELALAVVATGDVNDWETALSQFERRETVPNLARFARWVLDTPR